MMPRRWIFALIVLLAAVAVEYALPRGDSSQVAAQLDTLPTELDGWHSIDVPVDSHIVTAAGVDSYLNRVYHDGANREAGLYIGYYKSQRAGDAVHSPKNCLPASGWQPVSYTRWTGPGLPSEASLYIVENERQRFVVLYWYQMHGRTVASEYSAKFYTVRDSIVLHRSDTALVRITVPVDSDERGARETAVAFAKMIAPRLSAIIPR